MFSFFISNQKSQPIGINTSTFIKDDFSQKYLNEIVGIITFFNDTT